MVAQICCSFQGKGLRPQVCRKTDPFLRDTGNSMYKTLSPFRRTLVLLLLSVRAVHRCLLVIDTERTLSAWATVTKIVFSAYLLNKILSFVKLQAIANSVCLHTKRLSPTRRCICFQLDRTLLCF